VCPARLHHGPGGVVRQLRKRRRSSRSGQAVRARIRADRPGRGAGRPQVPPAGSVHIRGGESERRPAGSGAGTADRAGGALMPGLATLIAANPRPRQRPARYLIAILLAAVIVMVMIANSVLDFAYLDTISGRTSLYGLLTVALVALATYVAVRAFDRDRDAKTRARHLVRAGVLLGLAALLWVLFSDVFVFAGSAGPGAAIVCTLACLPTTAFALFVVRRLDRNEKEPWRLVLVAAAWG